jgi:hypothetical protein
MSDCALIIGGLLIIIGWLAIAGGRLTKGGKENLFHRHKENSHAQP